MSLIVALALVASLDALVVGLLAVFCAIPFRLDRRLPAPAAQRARMPEHLDLERWAA